MDLKLTVLLLVAMAFVISYLVLNIRDLLVLHKLNNKEAE